MMPNRNRNFDAFLLLVGKLDHACTNTECLLIHMIGGLARSNPVERLAIWGFLREHGYPQRRTGFGILLTGDAG